VQQKKHGAIRNTGQAWAKAAIKALLFMLFADLLLNLLPFHAERGIGKHVVKGFVRVAIIRKGITCNDIGHILPLDQHVSLADCV